MRELRFSIRDTLLTGLAVTLAHVVTGVVAGAAETPHVVFMIGEREYKTKETLPLFAREELIRKLKFRCTFVHADPQDGNNFPGLSAVDSADLLVLSVRRRALPKAQLERVRKYLSHGGALVGIRTANHAFHARGKHPEGHAEWQAFDPDVLGGHYVGHHGNKLVTTVKARKLEKPHPILRGVDVRPFPVGGSLYRVNPLKPACHVLMTGRVEGAPAEPVAWTHTYRGGRVFYTSLGHPKDFQIPAFRRLLKNAILWSIKRESSIKTP
tara:strand:- start:396 stop:1199 length:804 start_codon:yes stop_codon:yes gene_type:complete